jgi:hypothetical protein
MDVEACWALAARRLAMRRTVLLSFVVIGAVLAVVFGAGTFAPFTDPSTGTGTVGAAIIEVEAAQEDYDGADSGDSLPDCTGTDSDCYSFTCAPADDLLPDETTTCTFAVRNAGTRDFHLVWTIDETVDSGHSGCTPATYFTDDGGALTDAAADDHAGPVYHMANGSTETFTVIHTLNDGVDVNDCQGATFTITVTFTATGVADGA